MRQEDGGADAFLFEDARRRSPADDPVPANAIEGRGSSRYPKPTGDVVRRVSDTCRPVS